MSKHLRVIAVFLALLIGLTGCATTITGKATFDGKSSLVKVPDVVGLTANEAQKRIEAIGLVADYDGKTTLVVTNQSPGASVLIMRGGTVTLILEATTMIVSGTFTLTSSDGANIKVAADGSCSGRNGYEDISYGTQVVVSGGSTQVLALGVLNVGYGDATSCQFQFSVLDVPNDEAFYSIKVGNRSGPQFSKADLATEIELNLDS